MTTVVDVARAEVGYQEGPNNDSKYGKWYGLNNQSWCAMFVSWCFNEVGLLSKVLAQGKKGFAQNKSNSTYKSFVPWLRSLGYRVWVKPLAHASSSAADLLLQ